MEQKLLANEERFKFKDEEMIRLSHENVELQRQQLMLKQQLDRLQHYEVKAYHSQAGKQAAETEGSEESEHKEHHDHHSHDHLHDHDNHGHDHSDGHSHDHSHDHAHHEHHQLSPGSLPTAEAVERLQARVTTLISQVADLTEEKHSLEHLVLQLQGETETIGEYIALYQTQRRMLKQREYEKATQMRLLQAEREQLREKIEALNKLVASLGVELPADQVKGQPQPAALQCSPSEQELARTQTPSNEDSNGDNSQQILNKIQNIISEIKENTEQPTTVLSNHPVDHLNCCLGKFEVV